ncbi:AGE family epimerase/isomerase [Paenibacillus sp. FA6]|uniref:AGE family epimerase/isomerase n=1 Tax=Paenibacillus sp. FA6 TaxID=3413029 RepID=UPI003F654F5D
MQRINELHTFHLKHLTEQVLPFWKQAVDQRYGGIFTGFNAEGDQLIHRDKFTWSQGRFLWVWSRIYALCKQGIMSESAESYREQAEAAYQFLVDHAFLPEGDCSFLLTEDGQLKEMQPGEGYNVSFYADCFVIMGFAEYALISGDVEAYERAARLYELVEQRLVDGTARSEPYPIPVGMDAHGYAMIKLNTLQALAQAAEAFDKQEMKRHYRQKAMTECRRIVYKFRDSSNRIREVIPTSADRITELDANPDQLLLRHLNPGHSMESLWFVMTEAKIQEDSDMIQICAEVMKEVLQAGWDPIYGGLFRYIDLDGGEPKGIANTGTDSFEALIRETWDMKLWWPHSESLYACQLAYSLTGDEELQAWYERIHDYTFKLFPADLGKEWIQIRSRDGTPVDRIVALPVKDPYHIMRNLLLLIQL